MTKFIIIFVFLLWIIIFIFSFDNININEKFNYISDIDINQVTNNIDNLNSLDNLDHLNIFYKRSIVTGSEFFIHAEWN